MLRRLLTLAFVPAMLLVGRDVIHFSREFPGSAPPLFDVSVTNDGVVTYTEGGEEPVEFRISAEVTEWVFDQARQLEFFERPLASERKVASSGRKVLRYESAGSVKGESRFDYSEDPVARELARWFAKVAETERHLFELERVLRFDRLGIDKALVNLENAFKRDFVVAPEQFVPILEKISGQRRVMHLARARAAGLLERIEGPASSIGDPSPLPRQ